MANPPVSGTPLPLANSTSPRDLPVQAGPESRRQDGAPAPPTFGRGDLAAMILLVASVIAMFWKVLFTPSMLFYRDVANYTYPTARFIHEICRQGFLPYWNPFLNYGQPLLANPNVLFFYPYTLLIILLPIDLAYPLHYVVHFALAGIGTYLLARRWEQSRLASFFAAFVFTFSGAVLSLGNVYNHAACAAWIPWALLMADRALAERRVRPWLLLTLVFALQFLAGEPLTLIATFGLSLAYAFCRRGTLRPLWSRSNGRILAAFFLVGCLMVALCAVQFLPSADFLSHSRRGVQGLRYRESANWGVHPLSLVELVAPGFWGATLESSTTWAWLMGDRNFPYFQSMFLGFVPLFFALAGWALGRNQRRNFVAGAALVILLLSFGHFTPLYALAYLLVPLLMLVRYPVKLLVPAVLLVALLAGWGLDALRQEAARRKPARPAPGGMRRRPVPDGTGRRSRILLPLKGLLLCFAALGLISWVAPTWITSPVRWAILASNLAGSNPAGAGPMADYLVTAIRLQFPGLAGFALGGVLIVLGLEQDKAWARPMLWCFVLIGLAQMVLVNSDANPTVPKSFFTYRPPVLSRFAGAPASYRVTSIANRPTGGVSPTDVQSYVNFQSIPEAAELPPLAMGAFQERLLLAIGSMLHRVEGSTNLDLERSLPPYLYDLEIYLGHQAPDALHADCLLGRTNVKYLIRRARSDSPATRLLGEVFNGSARPSYLYEDLCFVPRAYAAGSALFTTSALETLRRMASPEFPARGQVILAAEAGAAPEVQGTEPAGQVEVVERHPKAVTLRAELSRPGYVVLLERYYPSWQATVDGLEAPVLRANQLFRAVYVPAGHHQVRFYYRQAGLRIGLGVSLATIVLLALLFALNPSSAPT